MPYEETVAVVVSVVAVWLTTRRSLWNYPFSLASVALYAHIFYAVKLYADMGLQGFFAATLCYGLYEWRGYRDGAGAVRVSSAPRRELVLGALLGVAGALALGTYTSTHTDAALPWVDASLTAASLVGSWWAARRRIENWWLWIAVDVVYVGVYLSKGLVQTAGLYAAFVGLAVVGLVQWRRALREPPRPGAGSASGPATGVA